VDIRLLGPVEVWAAGQRMEIGPPQRRAVLAVLAAEASRPVSIEMLIDQVWGEATPARVRSGLHAHITVLRRVLAAAAMADEQPSARLVLQGVAYVLTVDPQQVDLHRFRRLSTTASNYPDSQRAELLQQALRLWHGPALATLPGAWPARMRETWASEKLDAAVDWARTELQLGAHGQLISPVRALLTEYPLAEPLVAVLMRALAATGRTAEALDCFTTMRKRLIEQLGADPGAELQALHQMILRGDLGDSSPRLEQDLAERPGTEPKTVVLRNVVKPGQSGVPAPRPTGLPLDIWGFAGRADQLAELDALANTVATEATAVVIAAIIGTAGVGKTALAIHWAHHAAQRFPDGQLYVNLRGYDPGQDAIDPADAMRGLLEALGVSPQHIPSHPDARTALYRTLMAGKRILILLDNARQSEQVRPLLPGAPGSLVLVTSRSRLTSLVVNSGAVTLPQDLLNTDDARDLLTHRLGAQRLAAEPEAVASLIRDCAGLPLALAIVAARAATAPHRPLAGLAAELANVQTRLDALGDRDPAVDLRTVFSWSYAGLSPAAQRLFRLLGHLPRPDVDISSAASLAGLPPRTVQPLVAELAAASLVIERTPGRYIVHDLLRAYADHLAAESDSPDEHGTATRRVLDHYLHTAYAASRLLNPIREQIAIAPASAGTYPMPLTDQHQATAWYASERTGLVVAVEYAVRTGFDAHAWQIAWTINDYLERLGSWPELTAILQTAVGAAERTAEPADRALVHRLLARAHRQLHRYEDARTQLHAALDIYKGIGHQVGLAHTHHTLALLLARQRQFAEAIDQAGKALTLYQAASHHGGQGNVLNSIGWYTAELGQLTEGVALCEQALDHFRQGGDEGGQAAVWDSLGHIHSRLDRHADAISCFGRAIDLYAGHGDRYNEALTVASLGDTHDLAGDDRAARIAWQRALTILDDLHHPDAEPVRAQIQRTAR